MRQIEVLDSEGKLAVRNPLDLVKVLAKRVAESEAAQGCTDDEIMIGVLSTLVVNLINNEPPSDWLTITQSTEIFLKEVK